MGDRELEADILDQLDFEPSIDALGIRAAVDDAVVTLTGHVATFADKWTMIEIVESIKGVRAIVDEITVRPAGAHVTADDEIARRAADSLNWNASVPGDRIRVTVRNGDVTLEGVVEWRYQSDAAFGVVRGLAGVTGVNNRIRINPAVHPLDVSERIRRALMRDAELDATGIRVEVDGGTVTLEGKVRHLAERRTAERAAWAVPGVTEVVDRLAVR